MDWLSHFVILIPKGAIAVAERGLMFQAILFMLIVAIPVLALTFFFAWWYRAGNTKAKYQPEWAHSNMEELIWWAIPLEIILILGALTWGSTHDLDPRKPLEGGNPLIVQVVALDWKWLFIYPEQGIASVNYVAMPVGRPVRFEITADAPMNSFWIPQLGGQIYAMTGMVNDLNLIANEEGTYAGTAANYSGDGFAKMKFVARALPPDEFESWVGGVRVSSLMLDHASYASLREKSVPNAPIYFGAVDTTLYDAIVKTFMDAGKMEMTGMHDH